MKFLITVIIAFFALANLGFAAPIAGPAMVDYLVQLSPNNELAPRTLLAKRQPGGLFMCPAFDWKPEDGVGCSLIVFKERNQCITLNSKYYRHTISAIGPDSGNSCILYQTTDCSNAYGTPSPIFTTPGFGRLEGDTWGQYNDNTGSIKCWW